MSIIINCMIIIMFIFLFCFVVTLQYTHGILFGTTGLLRWFVSFLVTLGHYNIIVTFIKTINNIK